jgi:hypothetical protein
MGDGWAREVMQILAEALLSIYLCFDEHSKEHYCSLCLRRTVDEATLDHNTWHDAYCQVITARGTLEALRNIQ